MGASADRQPGAGGADAPAGAVRVVYRERLSAPAWWYPLAVVVAVVLGAEFHVAGVRLLDWVPYVVLVPLALGMVWWIGHQRLEVVDGELRVRDARLPLAVVNGVVGLDATTLRRVLGREGDPAAYLATRPWIGPGVQMWLDDPQDPTPYWVVSTRRPERLVAVLREHIAG